MLKFFLALRYLKKKKIVLLSIAAVALSTALLVTVASLFTAFIAAVESGASDYLGDIIIEPPARFADSNVLIEKLNADPDIYAATAVLSTNGLIHLGSGNVKAVSIWGIDIQSRGKVAGLKNNLLTQKSAAGEPTFAINGENSDVMPAFVGIGLIAEPNTITDDYDFSAIKLNIGNNAVITTGSIENSGRDSSASMLHSKSVKIKIADILFTSVYDLDERFVLVPIDRLTDSLGLDIKKPADVVHIKCAPGVKPDDAIAAVTQIWTQFAEKTLPWSRFDIADTEIITAVAKQSESTTELRKQMGVLLVIFGIISAGVIVLVFCIFYMIVSGKQKDLAVIKSIGGSSLSAASIFLIFGLLVGLIGASAGIAIGYLITHNVNAIERWIQVLFGLKLWSSSIYMFNRIPDKFNWYWAWRFFAAAAIASVIGALIPAISAARTAPAKILRYE
ncbi:MAG: FtsX-like permease family protein [Phycisphaerae bacterium]|jgi:ABC-type lipoprotein release transport system permease subunit